MRVLVVLAGAVLAGVFVAPVDTTVVSAHADLDFTLPTDGAAVGEPVREITVGFSEPVTLVGPGFDVLDPQGNILTPFVVTDDDMVFRFQLDPPIGGGEAAVRYEVRGDDGHTISGGFSFTISAEAPTTVAGPTSTSAPATTTVPHSTTAPTTLATTTAVSTTTVVATGTTAPPFDDDAGSSTGVYLAVAVGVVVAAGAFVVVRSRTAPPP